MTKGEGKRLIFSHTIFFGIKSNLRIISLSVFLKEETAADESILQKVFDSAKKKLDMIQSVLITYYAVQKKQKIS